MGLVPGYEWWQTAVIYQIYPRSFMDASGDGVGDLQGVIDRLDYLHDGTPLSLGVDALWLSPIFPSPMADFGYDVADYCDIDPLFGDLATFDRLLAEAHRRGLRVLLDYVPNHTSEAHPWFIESRASRDNPKRDWYCWRDAKPDGGAPNNWGSWFGGSAWEWDAHTGQYYFHQFAKEQPDLNWRNPQVVRAMLDVLRFWLARGVDGFRVDVCPTLLKDPQWRDNPPHPDAPPDLKASQLAATQLNIYNCDLEEVHTVHRQIRSVVDEFPGRVLIGETWGEIPRWIKYYGAQADEYHLPFNFRLLKLPWEAQAIRRSVDELEAGLPPGAWPNYVLGNHDIARLVTRVGGEAQARAAAMLLLTLRGTPTLYNGDEVGLADGVIPPERIVDPPGLKIGPEKSRDPARTPLPWSPAAHGGFSTAEPWLPLNADYLTRNVAVQSADGGSILNLYRQLLWLRQSSPALLVGSYTPLDAAPATCYAYLRQHAGERLLIALNFSGADMQLQLPRAALAQLPPRGMVLVSTHLDRREEVALAGLALRAHEGVIVAL